MKIFNSSLQADSELYLEQESGIAEYAEHLLSLLVFDVRKKRSPLLEERESLQLEQADLQDRIARLSRLPQLTQEAFFSIRHRLIGSLVLLSAIVATSIFLHGLAFQALALQDAITPPIAWIVAGLLAIVLTGGGLLVSAQWIRTVLPEQSRSHPLIAHPGFDAHETKQRARSALEAEAPERRRALVLWSALAVAFGLALGLVVTMEVSWLAAVRDDQWLLAGFATLVPLMPVFAGLLTWNIARFIDPYQVTKRSSRLRDRLSQVEALIRQTEAAEREMLLERSMTYWNELTRFRAEKQRIDRESGHREYASGVSAHYEAFLEAAQQRLATRLELPDHEGPVVADEIVMAAHTNANAPEAGDGTSRSPVANRPARPRSTTADAA